MCIKQSRRVGTQESDSIVLLHTNGSQTRGQAVYALSKLAIGVSPIAMHNGDFFRKHQDTAFKKAHWCQFRAINFLFHVTKTPSFERIRKWVTRYAKIVYAQTEQIDNKTTTKP